MALDTPLQTDDKLLFYPCTINGANAPPTNKYLEGVAMKHSSSNHRSHGRNAASPNNGVVYLIEQRGPSKWTEQDGLPSPTILGYRVKTAFSDSVVVFVPLKMRQVTAMKYVNALLEHIEECGIGAELTIEDACGEQESGNHTDSSSKQGSSTIVPSIFAVVIGTG